MIGFSDKDNSSKCTKSAHSSKKFFATKTGTKEQLKDFLKNFLKDFLDEIGIIESVKSVSNIIAPLTGTVTEVNDALSDQPDLVNQSAQNEGRVFS